MNFGGFRNQSFLVAFFAIACLVQCGDSQAQQQNTPNYDASQYQGRTQQLSQRQADQLAQMGGQAPSRPVRPFPELNAEEQEYLVKVLDYWQAQSEGINLYECTFERYLYDTGLTAYRDPKTGELSADSIARGTIRFGKPGKALYETTGLYKFVGHEKAPPKTSPYEPVSDPKLAEKWVTDGESVYEFDYQMKRIYETKLPPNMRGEGAISNSPIPFMFGARKDQILERYWVKVVTPQGAKDEVWLEAWPKRADDAQNYLKVQIILSVEPFLPKAVHMYMPQYNPKKNNYSTVYVAFSNQQVNSKLSQFKEFFNAFVRPRLPSLGWKFVPREQMNATAAGAQPDLQRK